MSGSVLSMKPVGPKADAWRVSRAFIAGIMGPVGSGKTSTGVAKCFQLAMRQKAVPDRSGIKWRRARIAVIRDTYPNLDSTVLATWHSWVPKTTGKFSGDAPRRHRVQVKLSDSEMLDLEMIFIAIGDNRIEDVLRGLELTGAWLNEADRLHKDVLAYLTGRVGRYPGAKLGGCVDPSIFMDFNAPDTENWLYELFIDRVVDPAALKALEDVLGDRPVIEFFEQPSAVNDNGEVNPAAENIQNLPPGYYQLAIAAAPGKDYVARMIRNKFIPLRHGQPVFPEFEISEHVSEAPIPVDRARKVTVGLDAGLTPAACFTQRTSLGDFRVLGELCVFAEGDEMLGKVGATRFGQALRQYLSDHFAGCDLRFVADPAAFDGTDGSGNEKSWVEIVAAEIGHRIRAAKTNRLHIRLEAVRRPMMRRGGYLMSPTCKVLRKAKISGYHYQRVALGDGTGRFDVTPSKNMFSHVSDAEQYAAMDDGDAIAEILGKDRRRGKGRRPRVNYGDDYFSGGRAA